MNQKWLYTRDYTRKGSMDILAEYYLSLGYRVFIHNGCDWECREYGL